MSATQISRDPVEQNIPDRDEMLALLGFIQKSRIYTRLQLLRPTHDFFDGFSEAIVAQMLALDAIFRAEQPTTIIDLSGSHGTFPYAANLLCPSCEEIDTFSDEPHAEEAAAIVDECVFNRFVGAPAKLSVWHSAELAFVGHPHTTAIDDLVKLHVPCIVIWSTLDGAQLQKYEDYGTQFADSAFPFTILRHK